MKKVIILFITLLVAAQVNASVVYQVPSQNGYIKVSEFTPRGSPDTLCVVSVFNNRIAQSCVPKKQRRK